MAGQSRRASRVRWLAAAYALAAALCLLLAGLASASERPRPVTARTYPSAVSFEITSGSTIDFGAVRVNTPGPADCISCLTIANNSSPPEDISHVIVSFDDTTEADCGAGGGWDASASSAGLDTFVMTVDLDHGDGLGFVAIDPATGSPDLLPDGEDALIAAIDGDVPLNFRLTMPTSISTGDNTCTIALTITVANP